MRKIIRVGSVRIGRGLPIVLIAGPCVIETESATLRLAERLAKLTARLRIPLIFKASYDKANRTSHRSFRGPGIAEGLKVLKKVKDKIGVPVISDVHCRQELDAASEVLDVLQVPAFLCRQTDLIMRTAETGKTLNIKKGQFLAPWDIRNIIGKIESTGNNSILITERGSSFGYNNLIVDMRSLPILREMGYPVIFDATHSTQLPGGEGTSSGGESRFVETLARAAVAAGCDGLFIEVHPRPSHAPCDSAAMLPLKRLRGLLADVKEIHKIEERTK